MQGHLSCARHPRYPGDAAVSQMGSAEACRCGSGPVLESRLAGVQVVPNIGWGEACLVSQIVEQDISRAHPAHQGERLR
jgi:hypothetical protein